MALNRTKNGQHISLLASLHKIAHSKCSLRSVDPLERIWTMWSDVDFNFAYLHCHDHCPLAQSRIRIIGNVLIWLTAMGTHQSEDSLYSTRADQPSGVKMDLVSLGTWSEFSQDLSVCTERIPSLSTTASKSQSRRLKVTARTSDHTPLDRTRCSEASYSTLREKEQHGIAANSPQMRCAQDSAILKSILSASEWTTCQSFYTCHTNMFHWLGHTLPGSR